MWLSFFEDWVFTDVWSGGGEHPQIKVAPASVSRCTKLGDYEPIANWVASAFKWETTHVRTQSPIKAQ